MPSSSIHILSRNFIKYAENISELLLEIGSGFGSASFEVLKNSTCSFIANDIREDNLLLLKKRTSNQNLDGLYLNKDRFPQYLNLSPRILNAVLSTQVFHFLRGEELDLGLKKIFEWLIPGGKLFISTATPYLSNLEDFFEIYEERLS